MSGEVGTIWESLSIYQMIGVIGSVCYLANYFALQIGMLDGNGHLYRFGSLVAATLVLISLTEQFNLASAIIQVSWITLSLLGFARAIWLVRRMRQRQADQGWRGPLRQATPWS